ncbi:MAG: EpsG family protein, partial [Treponema sp.]|nr:EpsG family protein [Treponema sp.]
MMILTFHFLTVGKQKDNTLNVSLNLPVFIFFFLFSVVFLGCRGFLAADWLNYYPFFERSPVIPDGIEVIRDFLNKSQFELGHAISTVICKSFVDNYLFFQLVYFVIDLIILHYFFKEYCGKYYFLGWALFYVFNGFNLEIIIIRNAKAMALFLLSIKYMNNRKFGKYLLLNIIGMFFHRSAILYIPLYFLPRLKRNKSLELILFGIGIGIYLAKVEYLVPIINLLKDFLPGRFANKVNAYMSSAQYTARYGISSGFLERVFSFVILYIFSDKIIEEDKRNKVFWYLFLIFIYICLYCAEIFIIIKRPVTLSIIIKISAQYKQI